MTAPPQGGAHFLLSSRSLISYYPLIVSLLCVLSAVNMKLYDTHVHFNDLLDEMDIESILAGSDDVRGMIAVGGSPDANEQAAKLALSNPGRIKAAACYGRQLAGKDCSMSELEARLATGRFCAIGETGLDFHYDSDTREAQIVLFEQMLDIAGRHKLPVIVHSRNAEEVTTAMLREHLKHRRNGPSLPGILHCFTGSRKFASDLLDLGFLISFSGIITFKNAGDLHEVAAMIPDDRLLIETDSPYLSPEPHRGETNTPAMVRYVAEALAKIRDASFENIASITARNAERLFL